MSIIELFSKASVIAISIIDKNDLILDNDNDEFKFYVETISDIRNNEQQSSENDNKPKENPIVEKEKD